MFRGASKSKNKVVLPNYFRVMIALIIIQLVSWGGIYYTVPVTGIYISKEMSWSSEIVTGIWSFNLALAAVIGLIIGRIIDRFGPRLVLLIGTFICAVSMFLVSISNDVWIFTLAWFLAGVSMAMSTYSPAFSALTQWYAPFHMKAITLLTLFSGFASTIFSPITALITENFSWREAYLLFAILSLGVSLPCAIILPKIKGKIAFKEEVNTSQITQMQQKHAGIFLPENMKDLKDKEYVRHIVGSSKFIIISSCLSIAALSLFATSMNMVFLTTEYGYPVIIGAWLLGFIGAGQILGRVAFMPISKVTNVSSRIFIFMGASGACLVLFALLRQPIYVIMLLGVLFGALRGAITLLQAGVISELWGTRRYGTISSVFMLPISLLGAVSPWIGNTVAGFFGSFSIAFFFFGVLTITSGILATTPFWKKTPKTK